MNFWCQLFYMIYMYLFLCVSILPRTNAFLTNPSPPEKKHNHYALTQSSSILCGGSLCVGASFLEWTIFVQPVFLFQSTIVFVSNADYDVYSLNIPI